MESENENNSERESGSSPSACSAWVYHFHAQAQLEIGTMSHWDGTLRRETPITDYDEYMDLKREILKGSDETDAGKVAITSLTLIYKPNVKGQPALPGAAESNRVKP